MFVFVNYPTEKIGINERETNIQNSLNNKKNLNSQRKYKSLYNKNKKENLLIKIKEITLNDFGKLTYGEQLQDL